MPSKKFKEKKARRAARRAALAVNKSAGSGGEAAAQLSTASSEIGRSYRGNSGTAPISRRAAGVSRADAWSQHSPHNTQDAESDYEPSMPTSEHDDQTNDDDSDYVPSLGSPAREMAEARPPNVSMNSLLNPRVPSARFSKPIYGNQVLATKPSDLRLRDLSPDEQIRQHRYCFISHPDAIAFCRICYERNHKMSECPTKECSHCHAWDEHLSWQCPTFRRCRRCRNRGHHEDKCSAAYMHPPSVTHPCDRCNSPAHIERKCPTRWRRPIPKDFVPVQNSQIRRTCYSCGSDTHFGEDCPRLPPQVRAERISSGSPWNESYVSKLVYRDIGVAQVQANTQVNGVTASQSASTTQNGRDTTNSMMTQEYNYQASLLADWDD